MQDGIVTADPLKLLDELGLSWAEIWQAVPKGNVKDEEEEAFIFELCGKSDPLDRPMPEQIRGIS
eukprot:11920906-Heterocapsa_arctica.AAC.1